ncbi:hypothetical protein DRJ48_04260 [Candidatus Woesearchaeota archaeon]|nr:MAG: hypothetical protein DRJ48_04260 [Candidatus Woesearchaeota archaeon]
MQEKRGAQELCEDISVIQNILTKHHLTLDNLKLLLERNQQLSVPVSIFKTNVGPLAALCVYLKDYKNQSFSEIAKLLNRDQRTIYTTYAKYKPHVKHLDQGGKLHIKIEIFSNRKLSIMENLVFYLKDTLGLRLVEIASMLGRNNKTIWCFYHRALQKNEN